MSPQPNIGSKPRGGIPRLRPEPIALLSYGFRPFFLGAALWACLAMVLWIGMLSGSWNFAIGYGVVAWHAHEFLFGYIAAVMTGFLLTAIPNWTGRLPLQGMPLLALFLLWLARTRGDAANRLDRDRRCGNYRLRLSHHRHRGHFARNRCRQQLAQSTGRRPGRAHGHCQYRVPSRDAHLCRP